MNDPHVVALFYNIEHSASVVYREAEPREYEAASRLRPLRVTGYRKY